MQGKEQQHKTAVMIISGMAIFKYTANGSVCMYTVFKWQNKAVSASVG